LVDVAWVEVEFTIERLAMEDEAFTMMPTVDVGVMASVMPVGNFQS